MPDQIETLKLRLRAFAEERDWEQFHSPKNLAMALTVEAGEVMEHFQWMKEDDSLAVSDELREEIALELADVQLYLLRLADRLDIDLLEAAAKKIEINAEKYPASVVRGSSKKYNEY